MYIYIYIYRAGLKGGGNWGASPGAPTNYEKKNSMACLK